MEQSIIQIRAMSLPKGLIWHRHEKDGEETFSSQQIIYPENLDLNTVAKEIPMPSDYLRKETYPDKEWKHYEILQDITLFDMTGFAGFSIDPFYKSALMIEVATKGIPETLRPFIRRLYNDFRFQIDGQQRFVMRELFDLGLSKTEAAKYAVVVVQMPTIWCYENNNALANYTQSTHYIGLLCPERLHEIVDTIPQMCDISVKTDDGKEFWRADIFTTDVSTIAILRYSIDGQEQTYYPILDPKKWVFYKKYDQMCFSQYIPLLKKALSPYVKKSTNKKRRTKTKAVEKADTSVPDATGNNNPVAE